MRVLALDIGKKRVGVAVSDPSARVASPVCVLDAADVQTGAAPWRQVLEDWQPDLLLCGLPMSLSGKVGAQGRRVRAFCESVAAACGLPIEYADERLSSVEAKQSMRDGGMTERDMRGKVDMVAASLFLQAWLDAQASLEEGQRP